MYLKVGDKERAMDWLERTYEERASMLIHMNVHFAFDPLRSDPRFQNLLRRMKFPS
jgi:hypothetical protein